jgi:hypothetical protein
VWRLFVGVSLLTCLLLSPLSANEQAIFANDPEGRFTGGAPIGKLYLMYGISRIPRATVIFQSNEKPGTIIINTKERRLYYSSAMAEPFATASASAETGLPGPVSRL